MATHLQAAFLTRRAWLGCAALSLCRPLRAQTSVFDARRFGAVGDGKTADTAAIQRTIDAASAAGGGQVLIRGGAKYLVGALVLRSGIDFHLADDAELLASTDPSHYPGADGMINRLAGSRNARPAAARPLAAKPRCRTKATARPCRPRGGTGGRRPLAAVRRAPAAG